MSLEHLLPNEATTEFIAASAAVETSGIQNFMEGLTPEQKRRFEEIAHHLVYVGFEAGSTRRNIQPTEAALNRTLIHETTLFLKGAGALAEESGR